MGISTLGEQKEKIVQRRVLVPVWKQPEPYFRIPSRLRRTIPGKHKPWRVVPDDKRIPVHELAGTRDCLVAIHPHAIVIGSTVGRDRKWASWFGMLICLFSVLGFGYLEIHSNFFPRYWFFYVFELVAMAILFLAGMWFWRVLKKTPPDWPILFNRKDRTITYFAPLLPDPLRFWKPSEIKMFQYGWDETRVRSYKILMTRNGRSFYDAYWIMMQWGGENGDPAVLSNFVSVGYEGYFEDERLFMVWEHIRRYMEEDGPPIQPGEKLRKPVNDVRPLQFPPEVIAAAGGPALSEAEVRALAGLPAEASGESW